MKPSFPQQRSSHLVVTHPDRQDLPVVAILGASGVNAPRKAETAVPPRPSSAALAMPVTASIGDYPAGDRIWLQRLAPDRFGGATNRHVLVPPPDGRLLLPYWKIGVWGTWGSVLV